MGNHSDQWHRGTSFWADRCIVFWAMCFTHVCVLPMSFSFSSSQTADNNLVCECPDQLDAVHFFPGYINFWQPFPKTLTNIKKTPLGILYMVFNGMYMQTFPIWWSYRYSCIVTNSHYMSAFMHVFQQSNPKLQLHLLWYNGNHMYFIETFILILVTKHEIHN